MIHAQHDVTVLILLILHDKRHRLSITKITKTSKERCQLTHYKTHRKLPKNICYPKPETEVGKEYLKQNGGTGLVVVQGAGGRARLLIPYEVKGFSCALSRPTQNLKTTLVK